MSKRYENADGDVAVISDAAVIAAAEDAETCARPSYDHLTIRRGGQTPKAGWYLWKLATVQWWVCGYIAGGYDWKRPGGSGGIEWQGPFETAAQACAAVKGRAELWLRGIETRPRERQSA